MDRSQIKNSISWRCLINHQEMFACYLYFLSNNRYEESCLEDILSQVIVCLLVCQVSAIQSL